MLTILPQIINETPDEKTVVFEAKENDKLIGSVTAALKSGADKIVIIGGIKCEENDVFILDGLCRAALSYSINCGAETACFDFMPEALKNMGFLSEMNIKNFFNQNCKNCL